MTSNPHIGSPAGPRRGPKFAARTAEEDESRLTPNESPTVSSRDRMGTLQREPTVVARPYEPLTSGSESSDPHLRRQSLPTQLLGNTARWRGGRTEHGGSETLGEGSENQMEAPPELDAHPERIRKEGNGHVPRLAEPGNKLGTFSGVFVPTTLNVFSILMFLRFGFVLGQGGFLGMMGLLIASYIINLVTTMSLSAIATNGTVRGGGAYYLISRSLGPEFGGSIGMVFYMGYAFNTGMNAVGLVDCFTENFGVESGTWANFLKEGFWWKYLWATIVLVVCTTICLAGSSIFARASKGLLVILLIATFSIPVSAVVLRPFSLPQLGVEFTGLRVRTFLDNLQPRLTKGAAGSQMHGRETFQDLFGILFPATAGIFAGASMSGDLKNPSKSIPKGTLAGLALTFVTYTLVILAMAASITRESFYNNLNVIQVTNLSGVVVLLGEFASTFFSALMGVIGSAKLLQAIARDSLIPGLDIFGQGSRTTNEPIYAILVTFIVAQVTMLFDINRIASFVTMAYLMTFLVTNLACFLLKIGSAPNFRPSFHYFNWQTAAAGTLLCGVSMFFVDGLYATGCVGVLMALFLLIHYTSPPKSWGDVSQSLIYHQVRKYLLRLRQEHVKFWRPQILLFVNDLEEQHKMVSFCNSLKKGGLFVLGNVIVTDDFSNAVPEARRRQAAWSKYVEYSRLKAFVNIAVSPAAEWGIRNVVLNSGLGGMRPNIVVIDQYRKGQSLFATCPLHDRRSSKERRPSVHLESSDDVPQAAEAPHSPMTCQSYVTILEDLLYKLRINVAVAKGFEDIELPDRQGGNVKKYIDLWPIQMSAELGADTESKQNLLTTNFDTYTLILQLGCILNTVPSWKKSYRLRVAVFVEYETDVNDERRRVEALLEKLRIMAEVMVFWLACGDLCVYQTIVNGETFQATAAVVDKVNEVLKSESWWQDIRAYREGLRRPRNQSATHGDPGSAAAIQQGATDHSGQRPKKLLGGLKRLLESRRRRRSVSSIRTLGGMSLGMQTHRLLDSLVDFDVIEHSSEDSSSSDSDFEPYESDESDDDRDTTHRSQTDSADSSPGSTTAADGTVADVASAVSATKLRPDEASRPPVPSIIATGDDGSPRSAPARPPISRSPSGNRFSSALIPEPRVSADEGTGPSIMFAHSASPPRTAGRLDSVYRHRSAASEPGLLPQPQPATGYPGHAAMPLSFNDLPSRAQHLILNELMIKHSSETAVLFTTLPSPSQGTAQDEEESESYLSNLEVLWDGLPPCLLVHSNSMTVTMNL